LRCKLIGDIHDDDNFVWISDDADHNGLANGTMLIVTGEPELVGR
jgi:hypothetical protein